MFFLGASCGFLPYILAAAFAWLLVGYNADMPVEIDSQPIAAKVSEYQQSSNHSANSYYYFACFANTESPELPIIPAVGLTEWGDYCEPCLACKFVLIPDFRGSPLCA